MHNRRKITVAKYSYILLFPLAFSVLLFSCSSAKKVPYFKDVADSLAVQKEISLNSFEAPIIKTNDELSISVETIDQKNVTSGTASEDGNKKPGAYLVDINGFVEVPLVGRVPVANLTTAEAKEAIRKSASKYYVDPIVNVRFMNFHINVLGDVARPGRIPINDEKVTIIDAISMAGDLNISAKRHNIMLIREEKGKKQFIRLNINSSDLFKSPYYYLKNGDIVYVEPNKARSRAGTTDTSKDRYIGLTASVLSLFAVFFTLFRQ